MAEIVMMTALSPTMEEGVIAAWKKKEGEKVEAGDVLCEVETDKATMDYESTQEGILLKIIMEAGTTANLGEAIAILGEQGESIDDLLKEAKTAPAEKSSANVTSESGTAGSAASPAPTASPEAGRDHGHTASSASGRIKASPLARKIAQQRNIDLRMVQGSGPGGRIVKQDVEAAQPGAAAAPEVHASAGADQTIPVRGVRATIAQRLSESKFDAPHFYLKTAVNVEKVIEGRSMLNKTVPDKVSFNAFLIKFVAEAIHQNPMINASWQGDTIKVFGSVDIGLAVEGGSGLITPIVRNCANRGIVDIDTELKQLITKARENSLSPNEYVGATFTISNLGSFGIEEFTAIINPPGAAILAVGQTIKTPVVGDGDQIVIEPRMKLTLSCDHRVIDGSIGARFLNQLKLLIEQPIRVLY